MNIAGEALTPALRLHHVGIAFRGLRALDDVSFAVPAGGISAIIGPNGAGKTTLFNCISGIYRHEGEIDLYGVPMQGLRANIRAASGIARTFQTPTLLDHASVWENVLLGGSAWSRSGLLAGAFATPRSRREEARAREIAARVTAEVGLEHVLERPAGALAHADRRRVEVARALVSEPRLLMLDEPAAGLSAGEADELMELVATHAAETAMTCILVEHDVALVMRTSGWIAVLDAGKVLATGTPEHVQANPAVIAAYLGADVEVKS
jgi:branched-chain amino acid transport system ATP-binding protein